MKSWKTPTPEQIDKAVALLGHVEHYRYFFDRLENPQWIVLLKEKGFFRNPPSPIREVAQGTVRFPNWPESRYLMRMVAHAPKIVLDTVLQIPNTENVRVHEDLVDAALAMPADLAAQIASKAENWIQSPYQLLLPIRLGTLVSHLAKGGQIDAALTLTRALLTVRSDQRVVKGTKDNASFLFHPKPQAHFENWHYKEILEKNIPDLVAAAGKDAFLLLCDLLDSAVHLSLREKEHEGPEDHSYIWRPAIEESDQNYDHDIRGLLVSAVRDAVEQTVKINTGNLPEVVKELECRRWHIFHRIALHLLRIFPTTSPELVAQRLTDRIRFDKIELQHEYALLVEDCFGRLSSEEQDKVLGWIEVGPDLERFKVDTEGKTQEEIEDYANWWRLENLVPFRKDLPQEWARRYEQLTAKLGEPEHPKFFYRITTDWHRTISPKSSDELAKMDVEEIVSFLTTWKPNRFTKSQSSEKLSIELSAMVASNPDRFATAAFQFKGIDPTYIRELISGFRDAAKQSRSFLWSPVLEFCRWIMEQPRELPDRKSEYGDLDEGWVWPRKEIAQLLSNGFTVGPAQVSFELRDQVWELLRPLTEDPEPTPEYEMKYGGTNSDPATLSINTTRGEAMHAVVRYALWIRRNIDKSPDASMRIERGLDEMPEVREVLDLHLNPLHDPALTIRAVYGQWFPWLLLLDPRWTSSQTSIIFTGDPSLTSLRDAAWTTYITFCRPYDNVVEILHEEYIRAIDRIGATYEKRTYLAHPDERLAEHLMILYWRGKLSFEEKDGLLARFYNKASEALRSHALKFIGHTLCDTKETLEPEIIDRLKALWEQRVNAAHNATPPLTNAIEFNSFGWWFASGKFDDDWAITQLKKSFNLANETEPDHLVAKRLAILAPSMPLATIECLNLTVKGDKEGWKIHGWLEEARTIFVYALNSTHDVARQAAKDLIHRLGARGFLDFRDLL